jgi:hypothetical protein
MKHWSTTIRAIDPITGDLKLWNGPSVLGISFDDAERYCQMNGLGYCKVDGELVCEIPCRDGTYEPDFSNMVDYDNVKNN